MEEDNFQKEQEYRSGLLQGRFDGMEILLSGIIEHLPPEKKFALTKELRGRANEMAELAVAATAPRERGSAQALLELIHRVLEDAGLNSVE